MAFGMKGRRIYTSKGTSLRNALLRLGSSSRRNSSPAHYTASPTRSSLLLAAIPSQSSRSNSNTLPTLGGRFDSYICLSFRIYLVLLGIILRLSLRSGLIRIRNSLSALSLLIILETSQGSVQKRSTSICGMGATRNGSHAK